VQLLHSSADPAQITSDCFLSILCVIYISKIIENDIIAETYINLKKSDQLILDTGLDVLSHI
jgi:hypothetical protein